MEQLNNQQIPEWLLTYPELDSEIFSQMSQRFGFDSHLESLKLFLTDIEENKAELLEPQFALSNSSAQWHSIKGAALTLGFRRLGEWSRFMEQTLSARSASAFEYTVSKKLLDSTAQLVLALN